MKPYHEQFTRIDTLLNYVRRPDFDNLLTVLDRKLPGRPTLFEFFMCPEINDMLTQHIHYDGSDPLRHHKKAIDAFRVAGYDYATLSGSDFAFSSGRHKKEGMESISVNEGAMITDRDSFERYSWPEPESYDYSRLEKLESYLPREMKLLIADPDGILENTIKLVGYDNLCFMLADNRDLVEDIFTAVGTRLMKYIAISAGYSSVGGVICGDDWGFKTQTILSPDDLSAFVFPWYRRIVETVHSLGKKIILHSCGNLSGVFDNIIDDMKFDGKHSNEDIILPVERAYDQYATRIAVLGGIDMDFICRATPDEVYNRSASMLERSSVGGGYALGSGNSIPSYIAEENYLAMIAAARVNDWD